MISFSVRSIGLSSYLFLSPKLSHLEDPMTSKYVQKAIDAGILRFCSNDHVVNVLTEYGDLMRPKFMTQGLAKSLTRSDGARTA
jgi:hypothetical protein